MRDSISLKQFITTCVLNILNIVIYFVFYEYTCSVYSLIFLTVITLDVNSIYLLISFICDISFFVFKSQNLEKINNFMRNKYSHLSNSMSYLVTILFWTLAALGGMGDIFRNTSEGLFNIYAHILITIFVIIDLFIAEHDKHTFSWKFLVAILAYFVAYGVYCIILTFVYEYPPYPFLNDISVGILTLCCFIFLIVCFGCYMLHILLYKLKFKFISKDKTDNEKEHINDDEDIIESSPL